MTAKVGVVALKTGVKVGASVLFPPAAMVMDVAEAGYCLVKKDYVGAAVCGAFAVASIFTLGGASAAKSLFSSGKDLVKEGTKTVVKEGSKTVVKEGTKNVVKEGTKAILKEGIEDRTFYASVFTVCC